MGCLIAGASFDEHLGSERLTSVRTHEANNVNARVTLNNILLDYRNHLPQRLALGTCYPFRLYIL